MAILHSWKGKVKGECKNSYTNLTNSLTASFLGKSDSAPLQQVTCFISHVQTMFQTITRFHQYE
jgi:hypothetical protein